MTTPTDPATLHAKQDQLAAVLAAAQDGQRFDLSRPAVLALLGATDATDATAKVQARHRELEALGWQRPAAPAGDPWAQRFVDSKAFQTSRATRTDVPLDLDIGLKALFETTAGFAPERARSGVLVAAATRPIQVLDLIPVFPIGQSIFKYMEETTRTHAAAERAEGAASPESAFVWTERTSTVQKITDSIPVTDEQLDDDQQVRSLLEQRLAFGLRQRLDGQVLVGDATGPNLRGLANVAGVQTQPKGTDPALVAFMKALTKIRFTGRASPSGAIFHPNDWQDILLTQNANGDYLFGNPFAGPPPQHLFGVPVAIADAQPENTGLVADFTNFTRIDDRRGVALQTGYVGAQFTEGKLTLRASLRAAFSVTRPAAVCQITGL